MRQCALCMFSLLIAQKASVLCFINQPCNRVGEHLHIYNMVWKFVLFWNYPLTVVIEVGEHLLTLWSEKRLCLYPVCFKMSINFFDKRHNYHFKSHLVLSSTTKPKITLRSLLKTISLLFSTLAIFLSRVNWFNGFHVTINRTFSIYVALLHTQKSPQWWRKKLLFFFLVSSVSRENRHQ